MTCSKWNTTCGPRLSGWGPLRVYRGAVSLRRALYALARLLGDVNAVERGTVGKRLLRRGAGKITGRGLGRLFR